MEDPAVYMKRFYEKALDYNDLVAEEMLVDVCLHGMISNIELLGEFVFFFLF